MVKMEREEGAERVNIAGSGRISGGTYQSVKVAGAGVIEGDVTAQTVSIAGSCTVDGDLAAEELRASGFCKVKGDVRAEEFRSSGSSVVEGRASADVLTSSGSLKVGQRLSADYIKTSGSLKVEGDVEADKFVSEGAFRIEGLLNADEISIRLGGECRASEIGGERIEVRSKAGGFDPEAFRERVERKSGGRRWRFKEMGIDIDIDLEHLTRELGRLGERLGNLGISLAGFGGHGTLHAETIEGDEIYLESTKAQTVRGSRVMIGPGCRIERVEYEDSLEVHPSAEVGERVKA